MLKDQRQLVCNLYILVALLDGTIARRLISKLTFCIKKAFSFLYPLTTVFQNNQKFLKTRIRKKSPKLGPLNFIHFASENTFL